LRPSEFLEKVGTNGRQQLAMYYASIIKLSMHR
jgi:hypothetical protein